MTLADQLNDVANSIPTVNSKVGIFVARTGNQVVVNVNATSVTLPFTGLSLPPSGHPVEIQTVNGQMRVTGPSRPLPATAVVKTYTAPNAVVTAASTDYPVRYTSTYTPSSGDTVSLAWDVDGGIIIGKLASATQTVVPPPQNAAPGLQTYNPAPFTAIDSGSFNGSWNKPDVWSSNTYVGAWFYGSKIRDTIPDSAVISSASIYLAPSQISGSAPHFQLHSSATKPGGTVAFVLAQYTPPGLSGWQPIPTSWLDYLKQNDGGVGLNHGGYSIWKAVGSDNLSGAISATYTA